MTKRTLIGGIPSPLLRWDTGGSMPHVLFHRADRSVRDIPRTDQPVHPGTWSVDWIKREPMYFVEIVDAPDQAAAPNVPRDLRIEIKCGL